jgi:signal transduction histidine kinase
MPIRGRIALYSALVTCFTILVFGVVIDVLAENSILNKVDDGLSRRGDQVAASVERGDVAVTGSSVVLPVDLRANSDAFVELLDGDGHPTYSSGQVDGKPPAIPAGVRAEADVRGKSFASIGPPGKNAIRIYVRRVTAPGQSGPVYVVAGLPLRQSIEDAQGLRVFFYIVAIIALLVALLASWIVAGRALRPLEEMARTAQAIGQAQDPTQRLRTSTVRDEVSRLTDSFNQMLGRLEDAQKLLAGALEAQRRLVADASHELRTPLTAIRSNAEVMASHPEMAPDDRQAAIKDIVSEGERMSRLVEGLLTLARADAGLHLELEPTALGPIVAQVCRQAQSLHPDRRLEVAANGQGPLLGSPDALTQLVWILVGNAVKHTPREAWIRVSVAESDGLVSLQVSDGGPGLPPAELERVFERFHQADPARSGGGVGLGLAIARWIAVEHNGRIWARNNPERGATFQFDARRAG